MNDMAIKENTLLKSLRDLQEKGFIKRKPGIGRHNTTQYTIETPEQIPPLEKGISGNTFITDREIPPSHKGMSEKRRKR